MNRYIPLSFVREEALKLGFQDCGAAKAGVCEHSNLDYWLENKYNADMDYMSANYDKRIDVNKLFEVAKTVFSFLISYNTTAEYVDNKLIATYALGNDYHKVLKQKLFTLLQTIQLKYPDFEAKICVDTVPILERQWAVESGLGWIGKNSCLINKRYGNKVFLAELICNYESDYSEKQNNACGNCNKCIESCPNKAIVSEGVIDCNKCISYQTIENKNNIPSNINLSNYVYGCDICLNACIWNNKAEKVNNKEFEPSEAMLNLIRRIEDGNLEKSDFNQARKHSPIERVKYDKLLDNIKLAKSQSFEK